MRWNSTRSLVLPCSCSMVYELRCLGEHMWYFPRWPQYSDGWSMYWIGAMVWYNEHLSFIYSNVDGPGLALHQLLKFVAPAFLVSISFDCPLTFWYIRSCLKPAAVKGLETIALVFEHISHLLVLWRSFVCIGYERRWNSESGGNIMYKTFTSRLELWVRSLGTNLLHSKQVQAQFADGLRIVSPKDSYYTNELHKYQSGQGGLCCEAF